MTKNYYEILRVAPDADAKTIRSAYRRLAQMYHPDKRTNKKFANHKFKLIGEAYAVLSDSDKRSEYDQTIDDPKEGKAEQAKAERAKAEQATERTSGRPCFICWIVWLMICFLLGWFDFWGWLGRLVGLW